MAACVAHSACTMRPACGPSVIFDTGMPERTYWLQTSQGYSLDEPDLKTLPRPLKRQPRPGQQEKWQYRQKKGWERSHTTSASFALLANGTMACFLAIVMIDPKQPPLPPPPTSDGAGRFAVGGAPACVWPPPGAGSCADDAPGVNRWAMRLNISTGSGARNTPMFPRC